MCNRLDLRFAECGGRVGSAFLVYLVHKKVQILFYFLHIDEVWSKVFISIDLYAFQYKYSIKLALFQMETEEVKDKMQEKMEEYELICTIY